MFKAKKAIPQLAAMSLALTGCGDSDGGSGGGGGSGGDSIDDAIEQFCMLIVDCYQDETQEECEALEQDYVDENISNRCLPLWTTYLNCLADLSCQEYAAGDGSCLEEVADEFGQAMLDECYSAE